MSARRPGHPMTREQMMRMKESLRLSFGADAENYERSRPGFPAEAAKWLIPDDAVDAVDVGAGTGKFTRALLAEGLRVTAVEPDAGMRAELSRVLPDVPCLDGSGESIPLPDDSVDLVTFAQSWHWVDPELAVAEAARVLRPGGRLGLIWNNDADRPPWMVTALRHEHSVRGEAFDPRIGEPFADVQERTFTWTETLPKAVFVDRVMSRSVYLTLPDDQRAAEAQFIRDTMDGEASLAGRDDLTLVHESHCFRARLP